MNEWSLPSITVIIRHRINVKIILVNELVTEMSLIKRRSEWVIYSVLEPREQ